MTERIPSGNDALDAVLGGGLPENGINLIIGHPGTGKTILAEQYLFHNAIEDRPGIYLSTVSEPFDKMLRYGQSLTFFDADAIGTSVFYDDLGEVVTSDGLPGVVHQLDVILKEQQPRLRRHRQFQGTPSIRRRRSRLPALPARPRRPTLAVAASVFWIGEYDRDQAPDAPEFAVADAIIALHANRTAERELRVLQVLKLRGAAFGPGSTRTASVPTASLCFLASLTSTTRRTTRSAQRGLDGDLGTRRALGDGYWPGAVTLIAGPTGAGKTLMGLHFLFQGADNGEPGVLATFQEHPTQLARIARGFGWDFDRSDVDVLGRSLGRPLRRRVGLRPARSRRTDERSSVVIDSLGDLLSRRPTKSASAK